MIMSTTTKSDAVWFTTKGQVVIPAWLRKQFHIEDGTKAVVQATPEGILLKPVTAALIRRGRGILKRKPGDKPLAEEWAGHKSDRTRPLKMKKKRPSVFAAAVGRALRRSARVARKTARAHGTPIYLWKNGKVVAEKP
jgi:AbrB family looped-hinge helix DNA binding protein